MRLQLRRTLWNAHFRTGKRYTVKIPISIIGRKIYWFTYEISWGDFDFAGTFKREQIGNKLVFRKGKFLGNSNVIKLFIFSPERASGKLSLIRLSL